MKEPFWYPQFGHYFYYSDFFYRLVRRFIELYIANTLRGEIHMPKHNADIAVIFEEIANLLEIQGANPFRIRAY